MKSWSRDLMLMEAHKKCVNFVQFFILISYLNTMELRVMINLISLLISLLFSINQHVDCASIPVRDAQIFKSCHIIS